MGHAVTFPAPLRYLEYATSITFPVYEDETRLVTCPHCGTEFDPSTTVEQILTLPVVEELPQVARDFLKLCPGAFILGTTMGLTRLSIETGYTVSGVQRRIQDLQQRGVVDAIHKTATGRYCEYRFNPKHDCINRA
jgi:hypothetical protein